MQDPKEMLARYLEAHGVRVVRHQHAWLELPDVAMHASAQLFPRPAASGFVRGQLDVRLALWPGRVIVESAAAMGDSDEAALAHAFAVLSAGTLQVWLSAFLAREGVARGRWVIGGRERTVVQGEVVQLGRVPDQASAALVRAVMGHLRTLEVDDRTHWVRVFTAQLAGDRVALEVLIDNEPWPLLQRALEHEPVIPLDGYTSMRMYFVITAERLEIERAAVCIAVLGAELDDGELEMVLEQHGATPDEAAQLVGYLPTAFGDERLVELGVRSDRSVAHAIDAQGVSWAFRLADQPVYASASRYAKHVAQHGPRWLFDQLAERSAAVRAVGALVQGGSQPERVVLTGPMFVRMPGLVNAAREG